MASTRSLFAAFALAAAALLTAFSSAFDRLACTAVFLGFCDFIKSVPAKFEQPRLAAVSRPVELVQACAYVLGIAKRERPHVRSQWRMCPST